MSKDDGGRHEFGGFVAGKAKHEALVAGSLFFADFSFSCAGIDALGDVGTLLGEGLGDEDLVGVKDVVRVGVADFADGVADDCGVVNASFGGDFTGYDDEVGFNEGFAGYTGGGVLG